jgi:Tfp pilus assembly protein PilX
MNQARPFAFARMQERRCSPQRSQRGVVIFIALIVLVAMTLAGIAMMRSSGSAMLTAGNLGFRQNATASGDLGLESARTWLNAQGPVTLELRNPSRGYYATWNDLEPPLTAGQSFDPLLWGAANWNNAGRAIQVNGGAADAAGNKVSYVIHRMCAVPGASSGTGAPANQECVTVSDPGKGGPKEAGQIALTGTSQVYFRVTARIEGPKNTVSYVQTMVY